jgi:hypothetical protein
MTAIVLIVIAALAAFAAYHYHLASTVKTAVKELFQKHASPSVAQPPVAAQPPVVTAPPPAVGSGKLPAGIDTPDANGFVALTGLPDGNYYKTVRFSIGEVGAALSGLQHASVALNTGFLANGRWITSQMIGVCAQIEAVTDGTTGAQTYRLKQPQVSIPGTLALPPSFTVASATAHFAALPDPNTEGSVGSGPKH